RGAMLRRLQCQSALGPDPRIMAHALTCRNVVRTNGTTYVRWSDKIENEFSSLADVRRYVREARADGDPKDILRAMLLDWWLEQNADGANASLIIGKTITYNPALPTNIVR